MIHTDICDPMSVTSIGGARYFATFIDDYTWYTEIVMLKKKSDIFAAFVKYLAKVERETGRKITKIRSDNAKEYVSKEFNQFLEAMGVRREFSVEYTSEQIGVAERMNRTIEEMARCMLLQSKSSTSLWAEAVNTAVYLRNRSLKSDRKQNTARDVEWEETGHQKAQNVWISRNCFKEETRIN